VSLQRATHNAVVTSSDDPDKRGRIRVSCPSLLGDDETELPIWVEPALIWGLFVIPNTGEEVEIEVSESSDLDETFGQTSIEALRPTWRGVRHHDVKAGAPVAPIHADFTASGYGKKRGFQTPRGHTFVFDDTENAESITLTWRQGPTGKKQSIAITNDLVVVFVDGALQQSAAVAEPLQVLYEAMKATLEATFNTHIQPTAMGPTGPPVVPLVLPTWDAMINSAKVKIPGN
jgi:Type VI secretion system/phage-baseplate injector OB domain